MAADARMLRFRLIAAARGRDPRSGRTGRGDGDYDRNDGARDDDAALAQALLTGRPDAAELAWNRYGPVVHGIVSRALGPDADVEDVTQEIFYRLFARIRTLRKPEALESFVVSYALRIVKWELRRRRARRWVTLSETGEVPDKQVLFMTAETRYALRRLYLMLDRLSARERLVLVLRHVEGMKLEEIADALGLSLATVKRALLNGSRRMAKLMGGERP